MKNVDGLLIGGAMAHAFWVAQGDTIPAGAKQPKAEDVEAARVLMRDAKKKEMPLLTPADTNLGFDIGPENREEVQRVFAKMLKPFSGMVL